MRRHLAFGWPLAVALCGSALCGWALCGCEEQPAGDSAARDSAAKDSAASKEPPRQSVVVTVQQTGKADFKVLASMPEQWDRKAVAQGLSQALFAARGQCGSLEQDAPDHAIVLTDGKVTSVQTSVGAPPSCFGAELANKPLLAAGKGFSGTVYLRTGQLGTGVAQ